MGSSDSIIVWHGLAQGFTDISQACCPKWPNILYNEAVACRKSQGCWRQVAVLISSCIPVDTHALHTHGVLCEAHDSFVALNALISYSIRQSSLTRPSPNPNPVLSRRQQVNVRPIRVARIIHHHAPLVALKIVVDLFA